MTMHKAESVQSARLQTFLSTARAKDGWALARTTLATIILTLHISSCTMITPSASDDEAEPAAIPLSDPVPTLDQKTELDLILKQAEAAFDANALTTPSDTSALHYYRELLALRPNHPAALEGLNNIVDRYIAWALVAIDQGNFAKAHQFLERAATVNPKSPSIAAASEQIRRKREQATSIEIIPDWLIVGRDTDMNEDDTHNAKIVSTYFSDIANKIDYLSAKATIYSKTDREGRWIYQQINAHTVQRLRATLKIDTPSRIELHFKPQLGTITTPPKAP